MSWRSIADLVATDANAPVALLGAPMEAGSVTPGRCDLAPATLRQVLRRFSTYDLDKGREIDLAVADRGDVPVQGVMPADGFEAIRNAAREATARHELTMLIGGNNAVTRPAAHGLGAELERVGLITLDAHFDMRDLEGGFMNGNPIRALLADGLPGRNICQIGLLPFANTARMDRDAREAGIGVFTMARCREAGMDRILNEALARLGHVDRLMVDFDIDVIDRAQFPSAPGARPGGMPAETFFAAARRLAREPRLVLVDLTEFDPSLDAGEVGALTAGRWLCEILAGFQERAQ